MSLKAYIHKRNFKKTPEPKGVLANTHKHLFVIQKHAASHLHYDFRLELDGVLKSWAVPKGPCLDSTVKRLAMHVEDHPVEYGFFEGIIPKGEYGGGTVMLWDIGVWKPLDANPMQAYQAGHLRFELRAEKLQGRWDLLRFKDEKHWFLIKYHDEFEQKLTDYDIIEEQPDSVLSQQSVEDIAKNYEKIWTKKGSVPSTIKTTAIPLPKDLKESPFPDFISPQLATLVTIPPAGAEWLHEVKFDGYRILAFVKGKNVVLKSRNNKDWTQELGSIADALETFSSKKVVLDGEVVLLGTNGQSDFQLLQNAIKANSKSAFKYYIFDILFYDKYDLKPLPLLERKTILRALLPLHPTLLYSDHISGNGGDIFKRSCELGLEGIISKRADSSYITKRSKSWLKVKCVKRQEFVIGGYSKPGGSRSYFGSLYLGVFNTKGELEFSGNVGTGFTAKSLKVIFEQLQKHVTDKNPFNSKPPEAARATWVKPAVVAEVEFTEWTSDGHLRHPSFKGIRLDKKPRQVTREKEYIMDKKISVASKKPGFKITHPDKILYPEDGITKQDLLHYYEAVSEWILPFIINRPLSLVRCPEHYSRCFFQRHFNKTTPETLRSVPIESKQEVEDYIYLNDQEGLLSLVQMGVLEIHPWGSLIQSLETPDIIIFDLDPAPEVPWKKIVAAAIEIKDHLQEYGLQSFVKTTGGKGLHVVIPVTPEYDWDVIKNFTHVFVAFLEKRKPGEYISKMSKAKRRGKIFVDYLRNQRSSTAIGAYSTRARIHAPVSVPVHWDELTKDKRDTMYTISTLPSRLNMLKQDPWGDFWSIKQSLHLNDLE